jgi:hypothetical protein
MKIGAERGGLEHGGAGERDAEEVGLELHEQIVGRGAAVDAEAARGAPVSAAIASRRSAICSAMPSRAARARWARVVPRVRPVMRPRASGASAGRRGRRGRGPG